jgi:hypothetical protein
MRRGLEQGDVETLSRVLRDMKCCLSARRPKTLSSIALRDNLLLLLLWKASVRSATKLSLSLGCCSASTKTLPLASLLVSKPISQPHRPHGRRLRPQRPYCISAPLTRCFPRDVRPNQPDSSKGTSKIPAANIHLLRPKASQRQMDPRLQPSSSPSDP